MAIKHEERLNGVDITVVGCVESLAEKVLKEMNRDLIIIFGYRSNEEQTKLYNQGRTTAGKIVTNAKAGQSPHNYACAVDCWVMDSDGKTIDWTNPVYKNICREHAMTVADKIVWGGSFKSIIDFPHWEKRTWRNVRAGTKKIIPNMV